jgi:cytochrome c oxidase assembly protein subunit 15
MLRSRLAFARYARVVLGLTVAVILWGAYVRISGSGNGCGSHWPMCNGEVIPKAKGIKTLVEFSHRASSGIAFLAVAFEAFWARRAFEPRHPARRAAQWALGLMVTEALVGAGLVLFEYVAENRSVGRAAWVATHLTNTFLLLAALSLAAWWGAGRAASQLRGQGLVGRLLLGALGALLVVGAIGAVTALGDTLFPASDLAAGLRQDADPASHFLIRLRVVHPVLAVVAFVYVLCASGYVGARRRSREVGNLYALLVALAIAQVVGGLANLALLAPAWMQIVHLIMADALWISLVLFAASALAAPASSRAPAAASSLGLGEGSR